MNDINSGSGKSILVAAVVGAAVGAGVALLFAPRSGKETREWLARRTQEIKDQTVDAIEQGRSSVLRAARELGKDGAASAPSARS